MVEQDNNVRPEDLEGFVWALQVKEHLLDTAQRVGLRHLESMRIFTAVGYSLTKNDLDPILAYNKIKNLKQEDITLKNVGLYLEQIRFLCQYGEDKKNVEDEEQYILF
mgnify:FL=1